MSDFPLFSVLVANYNCGQYLQQAIDSVLVQDYKSIEIVILDDGSTDNSRNIYDKYSEDERFRIIYNEKNRGVGYAKRRLIESANGEFCGFLDADDALCGGAILTMVTAHKEHPDCSVMLSRHYNCDDQLNIISESRLLNYYEGFNYFLNQDYQVEHFVSFRRDMYLKTPGISSELKSGEDQQLIYLLEEVAPCFVVDAFTYKYRLRNNSASHGAAGIDSFYWNTINQYLTSVRRGISLEEYSLKPFARYYENQLQIANNYWKNVVVRLLMKPILCYVTF